MTNVTSLINFINSGSYNDIYVNDGYHAVSADTALTILSDYDADSDIAWRVDDDNDLLFGDADLDA